MKDQDAHIQELEARINTLKLALDLLGKALECQQKLGDITNARLEKLEERGPMTTDNSYYMGNGVWARFKP